MPMSAPSRTTRRTPREVKFLQRVDDRGGVVDQRLPGHEAGEHDDHADVQKRADNQRRDDADGHVALRVFALFGGGRDGIEPNVGEEDDRAAGENSGPAIGREGMPVGRMNEARRKADEDEDGDDLQQDHDVVGLGRFADAAHQDHREEHHDDEGGPVEAEVPARGRRARFLQDPTGRRARYAGEIHRRSGCTPNQSSRLTMCWEKPTLTAMLLTAYSRMRSQPMIQAMSSPMVA